MYMWFKLIKTYKFYKRSFLIFSIFTPTRNTTAHCSEKLTSLLQNELHKGNSTLITISICDVTAGFKLIMKTNILPH